MIRRAEQVLRDPTALIGLLCTGQIVGWTLAPALTHSAPPLDVVEGYMWGREWVIASFKHPALPSWVLQTSRLLTGGAVGWPAYLVSQLFIAATFIFAFLLGREMMDARRGAAGVLLLTGIAFYAWPTPEFNHNVAETPFWAALPWAAWRAAERRGTGWWLLVGVLAAGGLYAKLTTALLLAALAAWLLWDPRARESLRTSGPWIGLATFLLLAAPLAIWLVTHDFLPLKYAAQRSGQSQTGNIPIFLLSIALNLVGVWIMLTIAGLVWPWRRLFADNPTPEAPPPALGQRELAYLLVVTLGPLLIAVAAALISGSGLKSAWGSPMFNLAGVLVVALTSRHFDGAALRRIAVCAAFALIVLPIAYAVVILAGPSRAAAPIRVTWPQAAIAERFASLWRQETGKPLRIVSGDDWVAGLVGITAKDQPSILNRGRLDYSPWITPERISREGMLVLWDTANPKIPPELQPLIAGRPAREERFKRQRSRGGDLTIGYIVVPPK